MYRGIKMNDISFNIEVINGNTDFIYRVRNGENDINTFVHKMIIHNNISCFVPYVYELSNNVPQLRYSAGSWSDYSPEQ